ncbi:hypothetical protein EBZ37_03885 [bacterium]|nr:hypothetical protein [bacterium]
MSFFLMVRSSPIYRCEQRFLIVPERFVVGPRYITAMISRINTDSVDRSLPINFANYFIYKRSDQEKISYSVSDFFLNEDSDLVNQLVRKVETKRRGSVTPWYLDFKAVHEGGSGLSLVAFCSLYELCNDIIAEYRAFLLGNLQEENLLNRAVGFSGFIGTFLDSSCGLISTLGEGVVRTFSLALLFLGVVMVLFFDWLRHVRF